VVGAGLSWGLVPLPEELLRQWKEGARELGCDAIDNLPGGSSALYAWAERILAHLSDRGGTPPKLALAKALGLLADQSWTGNVPVPLRGTTPRHRVIARFAREQRWASVWSLNWDCILENALERVGLERGEAERTQPWLTRYSTVVTQGDFPKLSHRDLFCVLKPHGCVRALVEAERARQEGDLPRASELAGRFMICTSELHQERSNPTDEMFFIRLRASLHSAPLVIVGWSVSEPYLAAVIDESLARVLSKGATEELSIIDVVFNEAGHRKVAECYGLTPEQVFFNVAVADTKIDTDSLFLWLQAVHCMDQLINSARSSGFHELADRLCRAVA
jgi:SIR2-like domain